MIQNNPTPAIPNPTHHKLATTSLVCGICGVALGPLTGIPAIIMGHMALSRIRKSGDMLQGHGKAVAGLVLGYLFSALFFLALYGFYLARSVITRSHGTRTVATAASIEIAVNTFIHEYGYMPYEGTSDTTIVTSTDTELLEVLLGMNEKLNTKEINFLTLREAAGNKNGILYTSDSSGVVGLYDPWGNGYRIRLDLDQNNKLEVGGVALKDRRIAVWSDGPDRKPATRDDIRTW